MNRLVVRHSLLLLLAAGIWGFAFVAQSVGMDYVGPFTFNGIRSFIGVAVLLPYIKMTDKLHPKKASDGGKQKNTRQRQGTAQAY